MSVVVCTLLMGILVQKKIVQRVVLVMVLLGTVLVVASGTPFPVWLYSIWCVLALGSLISTSSRSRIPVKIRTAIVLVLVLLSAGLCAAEIRYWRAPQIVISLKQPIYVIGDSISAGINSGETTWPKILGQTASLCVVNLAEPGATVAGALKQVRGIQGRDAQVILEIGGNNLLGDGDSKRFRGELETLLSTLNKENHVVAMFELPLPPFRNSFGEVQRSLAAKHNIPLIPKRCLAKVLDLEEGTVDDLHLSKKGHEALAQAVRKMLVIGQ